MDKLKEHKSFRNQLIAATVILFAIGFSTNIPELVGFGTIYLILAIYNIYTYSKNVKDYRMIKGLNEDDELW